MVIEFFGAKIGRKEDEENEEEASGRRRKNEKEWTHNFKLFLFLESFYLLLLLL